tara:strand:+ start:790 stop:1035 length:246 start_codon:yes stop_codon:yes gene_type:complete
MQINIPVEVLYSVGVIIFVAGAVLVRNYVSKMESEDTVYNFKYNERPEVFKQSISLVTDIITAAKPDKIEAELELKLKKNK